MKKLILLSFIVVFFSCEERITIEAPKAEAPYVVDAWLFQKEAVQTITVSEANTYFNSTEPQGIENATVRVTDINSKEVYDFKHEKNGKYTWKSNSLGGFGTVGHAYSLEVSFGETKITSTSFMFPTTKVDSITFSKRANRRGTRAEFWAEDLLETTNFYWIKTWKNDKFLGKPSELLVAKDGGLDGAPGEDLDKTKKTRTFIAPIRGAINPDVDVDKPIYEIGDKVRVQINSITPESFFFLNTLKSQTNRSGGIGALFAPPLSNLETNLNMTGSDKKIVGFFNVSAQEEMTVILKDENIKKE